MTKVQIEIINDHPSLVFGKVYTIDSKTARQMINNGMAKRHFPVQGTKPEVKKIVKTATKVAKTKADGKKESNKKGNKSSSKKS